MATSLGIHRSHHSLPVGQLSDVTPIGYPTSWLKRAPPRTNSDSLPRGSVLSSLPPNQRITMPTKYCPVCENTTYNCECNSSTACDACNQGRAAGHILSDCAFCGARDVAWCKNNVGGCDGCESCCKCNRRCEGCDEPFTDEHPECELDPGWHRGNPSGHCCIKAPSDDHWICQSCWKHYEPFHNSYQCEDCRENNECAEYGHEWQTKAEEFEPLDGDMVHVHAELECYECGLIGEICRDLDVEQL